MKNETLKQWQRRRLEYISYARSKNKGMVDDVQLILEAGEKFDNANPKPK